MNKLSTQQRDIASDDDWLDLQTGFRVRVDTTYLNHGSFGIQPNCVRYARRKWINRLDEQPMDFLVRHFEQHLIDAKQKLASFVGTESENIAFVENATTGVNVVANSFRLQPGDQVLVTDHAYGAIRRVWHRACARQKASVSCVNLPMPIESKQQIVDALVQAITPVARLLVISHVTSPTALVMPIREICDAFRQRGVAVCVDGPHAIAQLDLNINDLHCDFYAASCHKWLSAPLGSGFLYANPERQHQMQPLVKSWGRLMPNLPEKWFEEFTWSGTRDPSAYLSVPTAIEFLQRVGLTDFRERTRWLAGYAESRLKDVLGTESIANRHDGWYASMAHVPLPEGDWSGLQKRLREEVGIEVPVIHFADRWYVRVSCHLYTTSRHIDTLVRTIDRWQNQYRVHKNS